MPMPLPMPRCQCRDFQMAGFNVLKTEYFHSSSNDFLLSYDASYFERKYQEMQRISNSQKIQTKSLFEIFISFLRFKFDQKQ